MPVNIPERYQKGFEKIATAEDRAINSLLKALQPSSTIMNVDDLVKKAARSSDLEQQDAFEVFRAVLSLYSLRDYENLSTDELISELGDAFQVSQKPKDISDEQIEIFKSRIELFLKIDDPLDVSYKASRLLIEYEHILLNTRILTDIRPIFKSNLNEGLSGVIVAHILRLLYRDAKGDKELFVALDSKDVSLLLEQAKRALQKEEVLLNDTLSQLGIPFMLNKVI